MRRSMGQVSFPCAHICATRLVVYRSNTYEIRQMNMAFRVQQNVIRLHIAVNDTLRVDVPQCATHLQDPEPDRILCETFSRYVEAQVTTVHQIHHNIT